VITLTQRELPRLLSTRDELRCWFVRGIVPLENPERSQLTGIILLLVRELGAFLGERSWFRSVQTEFIHVTVSGAVPYLVDFEVAQSFCESQGLVNREKHH
jgi:hypothetical protein